MEVLLWLPGRENPQADKSHLRAPQSEIPKSLPRRYPHSRVRWREVYACVDRLRLRVPAGIRESRSSYRPPVLLAWLAQGAHRRCDCPGKRKFQSLRVKQTHRPAAMCNATSAVDQSFFATTLLRNKLERR